jgi:hypothetical protein
MTTNNSSAAVPVAGGTMTGNLILNGDPTTALQACTKQYADNIAAGGEYKAAVNAASTASLTATYSNGTAGVGATLTNAGSMAAFAVDGQTLAVNSRVLIKNQSSAFQNGIYVVTTAGSGAVNWVLTRSSDYNTIAQIQSGDLVPIIAGTVNANTVYLQTATVTTIGTDSITFQLFQSAPLTLPVAVTNGGTGVATLTTAYGTLCAGTTATGTVQTVSPGTSGLPLVSGGASALPSYAGLTVAGGGTGVTTLTTAYAPVCAGTTATGAVQVASTGLSTSGYVLTSNGASALPSFQAAGGGGGGGLTFIASVTASSSATVNFDNMLTSSYDNYVVVIENAFSSSNINLSAQFGTGGTPTYSTSGYGCVVCQSHGGSSFVSSTSPSYMGLSYQQRNNSDYGFCGVATFYNINNNNSGFFKFFSGHGVYVDNTNATSWGSFAGEWDNATVATSLRFLMSSGNIESGIFKLYGYQN